ncbi:acid phosphatase [Cardiobacterium valvarum]|uniref:Acid phosphatase n=2 Tax=Cardiobacterium valvarum TaxID=194702 RepID=A0A381EF07_9GAMM|nr:phosphatase PAP2 family protein [Cardiobacterium valvarum]EHM52435.1 acid phosphatase [Cardiobacterium valvarum F0432]SUX25540.1 Major phosphate-irrepressible acid phosphatase precursor [Cardiobacterium valvarum]
MKKPLLTTLLLASLPLALHAGEGDVTTRPDVYYMTLDEVADSLKLLPPPPAMDSIAFLNDKAQYDKGKQLRKTPRGELAYNDAHVSGSGVPQAFSEAFGMPITEKDTPEIHKLLLHFREDAGELATRTAKKHYMRIRPFAFFEEHTCRPDDEEKLSKNGSYPSGHTAIGWASALVLAEINPARQQEIFERGFEMGQSRVICGYHWQSDVDAARVVASAVVATLHNKPAFIAQLEKAKAEFKALQQK